MWEDLFEYYFAFFRYWRYASRGLNGEVFWEEEGCLYYAWNNLYKDIPSAKDLPLKEKLYSKQKPPFCIKDLINKIRKELMGCQTPMHVKVYLKGCLEEVVDTGAADYLNIERDRKDIPPIDFLLKSLLHVNSDEWKNAPLREKYIICSGTMYAYFCTQFAELCSDFDVDFKKLQADSGIWVWGEPSNDNATEQPQQPKPDQTKDGGKAQRTIDTERLKEYFVPKFKGEDDTGYCPFDDMVKSLKNVSFTEKQYAQIAGIMWGSKQKKNPNMSYMRPNTFVRWHKIFLECIGMEQTQTYKPAALHKTTSEDLLRLFKMLL